jgi:aspartokinase
MINITVTENQSIATISDNSLICELLNHAAQKGVAIDMIAQLPSTSDEFAFAFTFADADLAKLLAITGRHEKLITTGHTKIAIKSEEMIDGVGFAAKVFAITQKADCSPLLITTGLDEISLLVHANCGRELEDKFRTTFG